MISILIQLFMTFGLLSLLAVGGGTAVLPEMQIVLNEQFQVDHMKFVEVYSIGQLAPGPNMMMVIVFGFQLAGLAGALTVLLSFFVPSSILCLTVGRIWVRIGESPWRRAVQNALEPISIGLMCAGVFAVAKAAINGPVSIGLAIAVLVILLFSRTNPVYLILGSGLVGGTLMYFTRFT
ncbi:chromate transporter [Polynucleobacter sp. IMCC 29146]|uniref:chromate transporter n=1 Tax=Polynucleobacter sp. IMCC 29146 TaxID=2780953 RepID=UPI001F250406|nr:chromate transporter [Polynucleobacter sp. IMCC 29146]MCE7528810.1 chromate transporter [Polynucleobacter sp. IMCC 29146]